MYDISDKHWAVKIHTETSITDANIGLSDGVMYFTTDGYDGVGGTYEGGGAVEQGVWNGDLLDLSNPFQSISSRIDLVDGGDYAYLSNATIKLVNTTMVGGSFSNEFLGVHGMTPVGFKAEIFVVVNGVFYSRWVGSVSDLKITDKEFTFRLKDTNQDDEETVEDVCYGYIHRVPVAGNGDTEDRHPVITVPLTRYDYIQGSTTTVLHIPNFMRQTSGGQTTGTGDDAYVGVPAYRIWLQQDYDITSDLVFAVARGEAESSLYDISSVVHTADDYGNQMTIVHFDGILDVEDQLDLFGNYEEIPPGSEYTNLYDFNGVLIKFYDKVTTVRDEVDTSKLVALYSSSGVELPLDSIIDGEYFKERIEVSKKVDIEHSDISWNIADTGDISGIRGFPAFIFPIAFDGQYDLEGAGSGEYFIQTLIDCTSALTEINPDEWDNVYLGTDSRKALINAHYNVLWWMDDLWFNWTQSGDGRDTPATLTYKSVDGTESDVNYERYDNFIVGDSLWNAFEIDIYPSYIDDKYGIVVIDNDESLEVTAPYGDDWSFNIGDPLTTTYNFAMSGSSNCAEGVGGDILHYEGSIPVFRNDVEPRLYETQYGEAPNSIPDVSSMLTNSVNILTVSTMSFSGRHQVPYLDQHTDNTQIIDYADGQNVQSHIIIEYSLVGKTTIESGDGVWGSCRDDDTLYVSTLLEHLAGAGDYTKLSTRNTWEVGYIVENQTSKGTLIADICKQSFVLGHTNRFGVPAFSAYRDYTDIEDVVGVHDGRLTIKGTLGSLETTPTNRIYNELEVNYERDYVDNEYVDRIAIRKVTESEFPPSGGNWQEFVIGVEDYAKALELWTESHEAYEVTKTINKVTETLSELSFGNRNRIGTESFGLLAISEMVSWNTRPRLKVEYTIPITSETATLDLGDFIVFSDVILTNDVSYYGWITKLDIDDKKFNFKVQLTIDPAQLGVIRGDWVIEDTNVGSWYGEDATNIDWVEETGV